MDLLLRSIYPHLLVVTLTFKSIVVIDEQLSYRFLIFIADSQRKKSGEIEDYFFF